MDFHLALLPHVLAVQKTEYVPLSAMRAMISSHQKRHNERILRTEDEMRVVVAEFVSLDGVVQAPGGPQEDTSGGFRHGGWSLPFFDPEVMGPVMNELAERSDALLQGRRTYQVSAAAWPERGGNPFADWINGVQKYVVSETLTEADLTWQPTTIIRGAELVDAVSELRGKPGGDIYIYGSVSLVRALLAAGLVDELVLMIEPIILGGGKTLFPTDGEARKFELISAATAATGVQVCRYRPAG
jgi:dihydrofolate reductase